MSLYRFASLSGQSQCQVCHCIDLPHCQVCHTVALGQCVRSVTQGQVRRLAELTLVSCLLKQPCNCIHFCFPLVVDLSQWKLTQTWQVQQKVRKLYLCSLEATLHTSKTLVEWTTKPHVGNRKLKWHMLCSRRSASSKNHPILWDWCFKNYNHPSTPTNFMQFIQAEVGGKYTYIWYSLRYSKIGFPDTSLWFLNFLLQYSWFFFFSLFSSFHENR